LVAVVVEFGRQRQPFPAHRPRIFALLKSASPQPGRFPPPWTFKDYNNACFIVKDANGADVAYVYYEEERGRRTAANLMTRDEARRIAANIAKLPRRWGARA
jgi:hypothetical protein